MEHNENINRPSGNMVKTHQDDQFKGDNSQKRQDMKRLLVKFMGEMEESSKN